MLKKNVHQEKIGVTKNAFYFFRELQVITLLLFIPNFYMSWNFISLKLSVVFSIFDSASFLL